MKNNNYDLIINELIKNINIFGKEQMVSAQYDTKHDKIIKFKNEEIHDNKKLKSDENNKIIRLTLFELLTDSISNCFKHNKKNIRSIIISSRATTHLTQKEIANKLNIPIRTYQSYENGTRFPKIETLIRIQEISKIDYNLFFKALRGIKKNYIN